MEFSIAFFGILGKFSVCGGAPTINAKNFSSLAFLLGHKRSLCPFLNHLRGCDNVIDVRVIYMARQDAQEECLAAKRRRNKTNVHLEINNESDRIGKMY